MPSVRELRGNGKRNFEFDTLTDHSHVLAEMQRNKKKGRKVLGKDVARHVNNMDAARIAGKSTLPALEPTIEEQVHGHKVPALRNLLVPFDSASNLKKMNKPALVDLVISHWNKINT